MQEILVSLIGLMLVEPLHVYLTEMLQGANAPQALVSEVTECAKSAARSIAERATTNPWWAIEATARFWTGISSPEALLVEAAPRCRGTVDAARPFLIGATA
jgi:hypothetical protein